MHVLVLLHLLVGDVYQINHDGDKDDKTSEHVHFVVFQPYAATSKEHVQRDE